MAIQITVEGTYYRVFDLADSTQRVRQKQKRSDRALLELGLEILWVKLNIGHGRFLNWLKEEVHMGSTSAENLMDAARDFITGNKLGNPKRKTTLQRTFRFLASNSQLTVILDRDLLWGNKAKKEKKRATDKDALTSDFKQIVELLHGLRRFKGTSFEPNVVKFLKAIIRASTKLLTEFQTGQQAPDDHHKCWFCASTNLKQISKDSYICQECGASNLPLLNVAPKCVVRAKTPGGTYSFSPNPHYLKWMDKRRNDAS